MGFPGAATNDETFVDGCDCNLPGPELGVSGGGKGIGGPKPMGGKFGGAGIELPLKPPGGGGGGGPAFENIFLQKY